MQEALTSAITHANDWALDIYLITVAILASIPVYFKLNGAGENKCTCVAKCSSDMECYLAL